MNTTGGNEGFSFLDHYTYGLHPQELGYGIKAYSEEINKKFYEKILEKVINSVNLQTVSKNREVRIFYTFQEKAIISLVTADGMDASKRKGIYSHNIVVGLHDYAKLGAHPSIFDKYFIRDVNLRGKIERLSVTPALKYEPSEQVEIPAGTLKNILSVLLRGQRVGLICRNKDAPSVLKTFYFLLGLLPPTDRFIPYITVFPEKNQSSYKLIVMQEEEYTLPDKDWIIFNIDEEKNFSPKDAIDKAVDSMLYSYFKKGYEGLEEYHKLWYETKQKNPDIEVCPHNFFYKINIKEKGIQSFLEETIKKLANDTTARCDFIIDHHLEEIPPSKRFESFISLSKLKLNASKGNFNDELKNIIEKANSNFSKKEQLEMIALLGKEFPNYKTNIYSYIKDLENEPEFNEYIKKYPEMITGLDKSKRIEYIDYLPLDKKLVEYYHIIDEIVEMLHNDEEDFSKYEKSLNTLYEYIKEPKYHNKERNEKAKFIIKKFVDALDKTVERKGIIESILKSTPKTNIPIHTIGRLFPSKSLFILLYCLKYFNLVEYEEKLERISKEYVGIIFSLSGSDIKKFLLNTHRESGTKLANIDEQIVPRFSSL